MIHVIHPHTTDVVEGAPKLPATSRLEYGEIAVNYAEDHETLSIKNDNDDIVTFSSDNVIKEWMNEDAEVIAAALTDIDARLTQLDTNNTDLTEELEKDELALAIALNDLNDRLESVSTSSEDNLDKIIPITYAELKDLRDDGELVPGQQYRITDYLTMVNDQHWFYTENFDISSANHAFDIIVTADSDNKLNENARAIAHAGDTYFSNCNLAAWELKYSLDNDAEKYSWAGPIRLLNDSVYSNGQPLFRVPDYDGSMTGEYSSYYYAWGCQEDIDDTDTVNFVYTTTENPQNGDDVFIADSGEIVEAIVSNGKGVIYYMKDDWNNECPYDFKNILFKRKLTNGQLDVSVSGTDTWVYTFNAYNGNDDECLDASILNGLTPFSDVYTQGCFNNVIKPYNIFEDSETIFWVLNDNVFLNTFGSGDGYSISYWCKNNFIGFDSFSNTIGNGCYSNTIGNRCYANAFGQSCFSNTFGNSCYNNFFGDGCGNNTFGDNCYANAFGQSCFSNTFGNSCYCNMFGKECVSNTFGNSCSYIYFGTSSSAKNYYRNIIVDNGNNRINLTTSATTSSSNYLQNIHIGLGVNNSSTYKTITHTTAGDTFETKYVPTNSQTINI